MIKIIAGFASILLLMLLGILLIPTVSGWGFSIAILGVGVFARILFK